MGNVKTVSMSMDLDFPLAGKELKPILKAIHKLFTLVAFKTSAKKYQQYLEFNPSLATNFDKLLNWSENNGKPDPGPEETEEET